MFSLFPEKTIIQFADAFVERRFKKGELLLREGQICKELIFILNGNVMCYYLKNGKKYIDEFSLDCEFITDYSSLINQTKTDKYIECIENCTAYCLSRERMYALYEKGDVSFERLGRLMAEQLFLAWNQRSKSLLMDNASERYIKLIQNRPHLAQRVPQFLIAEYLGITPESLSRIKSELMKA